MGVSPESKATTITEFIEKLAIDDGLMLLWVRHRGAAIRSQALSAEDQQILLEGDFEKVKSKVKTLAGPDAAPARWLVIWIV